MISKTLIIASVVATPLLAVIYQGTQAQSSFSDRIDDLQNYPWCYWSGDVKDGKPHGWGVGSCVFGQEPPEKRILARPPRPIGASLPTLAESIAISDVACDGSNEECTCKAEIELVIANRIDDYITFRGHYVSGKREGYGTFFYSGGSIYIGNWKNDKRHGDGALFDTSCVVRYVGAWCNDEKGACLST